jgi:hypothetical protein
MKTPLDSSRFWFLRDLNYSESELEIVVEEGIVGEPSDVNIAGHPIRGSRPVELNPQSRKYRIVFTGVSSFKVTEETLSQPDKYGEPSTDPIRQYNKSEYLELFGVSISGSYQHFSLITTEKVIDVLSRKPPIIEGVVCGT